MGTRLTLGGKEGSSKKVDVKTDTRLTERIQPCGALGKEASALEGSKHIRPRGPSGQEQIEIRQRTEMWSG